MAALVVVVALLLVSVSAAAIPAAEINPDRPEVTESAKLVPRGAVQLESGVALSRERRADVTAERTFQIEGDLRIGVAHDIDKFPGRIMASAKAHDKPLPFNVETSDVRSEPRTQ